MLGCILILTLHSHTCFIFPTRFGSRNHMCQLLRLSSEFNLFTLCCDAGSETLQTIHLPCWLLLSGSAITCGRGGGWKGWVSRDLLLCVRLMFLKVMTLGWHITSSAAEASSLPEHTSWCFPEHHQQVLSPLSVMAKPSARRPCLQFPKRPPSGDPYSDTGAQRRWFLQLLCVSSDWGSAASWNC